MSMDDSRRELYGLAKPPKQTKKAAPQVRSNVFPLRFKDSTTQEHLRLVAEQLGVPMSTVAEVAIQHEITRQGWLIENRLAEAMAVVRRFQADADVRPWIAAVAEGEASGEDPFRQVRALHDLEPEAPRRVASDGQR